MFASALGVLKWPPEAFRKATIYEYTSAMKGHLMSKGIITQPDLTRVEVDAAWATHKERMKAAGIGN